MTNLKNHSAVPNLNYRMRPNLELHIGELVLHGISVHNRYAVARAVEDELLRLFTEQGLPSPFKRHVNINAIKDQSFTLQENSADVRVAGDIASSVYKSLNNVR